MTEQYSDGLGSVQLHLVDSVEEAGKFLTWAGERRPFNRALALDIETGELPGRPTSDALSPWKGQIRLMQIGDGEQGWSIPWDDWKGVFYEWTERETSCPIVIHNINFESKWMTLQSKWDFPWGRCHDTMLMSRVINPLRSAALKTLSGQIVDPLAAAMQGTLNKAFAENGWTWGSVPMSFGPFWQYGALDPVLTMRIFEEFWKDCAPGKRYSIPYELEMAARKVCTMMEINGSRINLEYSQDMYNRLTEYTKQVKSWAKETYNGLSITSNVQLVHQFERMGAEITQITATGNKSVTKDQLDIFISEGNKEVRDLAEAVLNQRKYDKVAGSYFLNFMKDHIDGVLHPQINTMAARTSRMSVTEPALQTLPSGDPLVRRAFIPREEGQGILSCDLSSAEFRVCTILSNDQALIDLFNDIDTNGGDAFTEIMRDVYRDKTLQKSDPRRKLIKSSIYGRLFGAGVTKMAHTSGVPVEQMQPVVDAFNAKYPGVERMQREIEDIAMQRLREEGEAYVITKTGRRLPGDADKIYALMNYLIQGSAAEILKNNLLKIDKADLSQYLMLPIHDEVVSSIPLAEAKEISATIQECMTTRDWGPIAIPGVADKVGANWGVHYEKH